MERRQRNQYSQKPVLQPSLAIARARLAASRKVSPARPFTTTLTPRSQWGARSLPRFPFAHPAPTFFLSPGKISRVQGPQVLNGHLEDLRLLQLPGTLQKEKGLLAAAQRAQASPSWLGTRFYLERTSEQALLWIYARAAWGSLSVQAPQGRRPACKALFVPRLLVSRPHVTAPGTLLSASTLPASPGPWAPSCPARSNSG